MSDVTRILSQIESGDPSAAEQLLPLVYDELRKLAAARLAQEKPGMTLQATALVHEAYLKLVDGETSRHWNSRGHFFGAAAVSMRRILVDLARRKQRPKHGGQLQRVNLEADCLSDDRASELLALHLALEKLEAEAPEKAQLVKLRYFAGLSHQEAAQVIGVSRASGRTEQEPDTHLFIASDPAAGPLSPLMGLDRDLNASFVTLTIPDTMIIPCHSPQQLV